jgi:hypothetical protein
LISVSLAPGSYLFCADAEAVAIVMLANTTAAVIHIRWNAIKSSQIFVASAPLTRSGRAPDPELA